MGGIGAVKGSMEHRAWSMGQKISDFEFRPPASPERSRWRAGIADLVILGRGRRQWAALEKESGVKFRIQEAKDTRCFFPFWLLTTGYWLLELHVTRHTFEKWNDEFESFE
jgi:hypothetical protein